jgi:hypothetical protein
MFVSKEPVPVCVAPPETPEAERDIIYIRPKMDYGTKQRVQYAIMHAYAGMGVEGLRNAPLDIAAANIALLVHNVLRWSGPAFDGVPCDAEHIEGLDDDEPLVQAVLAEINARNAQPSAEKNGLSAPVSMNGGGPSSRASAKSR